MNLGDEPARYGRTAIASELAERDPAEVGLLRAVVVPFFPAKPLGPDALPGHTAFREILEAVATIQLPDSLDEHDRHEMLSLLDEFPVAERGLLGEWLLDTFAAMVYAPSDTVPFGLQTFRYSDGLPQFVVGLSSSNLDEATQLAFYDLVQVRHDELRQQASDPQSVTTFGFVLAPDDRKLTSTVLQWPWSVTQFVCVRGPIDLNPAESAYVREFWTLRDG